MKKIKVLHKVLMVINIMILIGIIFGFALFYGIVPQGDMPVHGQKPNQLSFIILNLFSLIQLFGMYQIQKSFNLMININYFNLESVKLMKTGGYILIITSITSQLTAFLLFGDIIINEITPELGLIEFLATFITIVIGVGFLIFADTLSRGNKLKEDNDLTI